MMNHTFTRTRRAVVVALCLGLLVVALGAMTALAADITVTPNNAQGWITDGNSGGGSSAITTTAPRSGDGSVELTGDRTRWLKAVNPLTPAKLGDLYDVTDFAFDWMVAVGSASNLGPNYTPALRLHVYDPNAANPFSELIWEGAYNGPVVVTQGSWISTDMIGANQELWRWVTGEGVTLDGNGAQVWQPIGDWQNAAWYSADAVVFGVSVGVGSSAGAGYHAFADNVVMGFNDAPDTFNFEPDPQCDTVCYADAVNGDDANDGITPATAKKTIQAAIDQVSAGGEVRVLPGNYSETATGRDVFGAGSYQFGLFFEETAKNGVTVVGVTAADVAITDPALTEAFVTTNATNSFGYSGIFVEADDVTIAGLEIGDNAPSNNKTIEIAGDGFTLKDSKITVSTGGAVYFGDWNYDELTGTAYIESYTITNNDFGQGGILSINNGAGASGPVSGRQITGNTFAKSATQAGGSVVFTGDGTTVPWFVYPVGGAVITGNTFTNLHPSGVHIMVRGMADDSEWDWASYWNDNTFNKAVIVGPNLFDDVRAYSYTSGVYTFNDVRQIGAAIQPEINHAADGDTVLVNEGTYPESPNVNKSVTLLSDDGRDLTFIELQPQPAAPTYLGTLYIDGADVTVDGFTVTGFDADCADTGVDGDQDDASTNILTGLNAETVVVRNNRFQVGAKGACQTWDDAIGVATTYSAPADTLDSLLVENNIFEPANATAGRAFYVNPGTVAFTFRGNEINGEFTAGSYTQAKDGLVENNTINGTGTSRGMGTWGYPDPTLYGATLFRGNTISDVVSGITIYGSENVTVTKNHFTGNGHAVWVDEDVAFDLSTIHINRNSIAGNDMGVENWYTTDVDATCNWWGAADGPGPVGPGSGDPVGPFVDFAPFLVSDDLDGLCAQGIFVSTNTAGTTSDGLAYSGEDIIMWDGLAWSMWFDGTAAGLDPQGKWKHNLNAIWIPDPAEDDFIFSFTQNRRHVPGMTGPVDGMDLVQWDGTAFSLYFDGQDVFLTNKTQEKIDSLHVLPGSASPIGANCQAYLLISTQGPGKVRNYDGTQLKFGGEDVLGFCMTNGGADTDGLWHMVLDGSSVGMPRNSTSSISLSDDGNTLYLTTKGTFQTGNAAGGHSNVFAYDMTTQTFSGPIFDAQDNGLTKMVDALELVETP